MNFTITKSVNFKLYWHMDDKLYKHANNEQVENQVGVPIYWLIYAQINPIYFKLREEVDDQVKWKVYDQITQIKYKIKQELNK